MAQQRRMCHCTSWHSHQSGSPEPITPQVQREGSHASGIIRYLHSHSIHIIKNKPFKQESRCNCSWQVLHANCLRRLFTSLRTWLSKANDGKLSVSACIRLPGPPYLAYKTKSWSQIGFIWSLIVIFFYQEVFVDGRESEAWLDKNSPYLNVYWTLTQSNYGPWLGWWTYLPFHSNYTRHRCE